MLGNVKDWVIPILVTCLILFLLGNYHGLMREEAAAAGLQVREERERSAAVLDEEGYYRWGYLIDFTRVGNAHLFLGEGWSGPGETANWTNSERASMCIPLREAEGDLELRMVFLPFVKPDHGLAEQRVGVLVNGREVEQWVFVYDAVVEKHLTIESIWLDQDCLELVFELPDATVPQEIGYNEDARQLGIAVRTMTILQGR